MKLTWLMGLAGAIAMAAGCGGDDRPKMIDTDVSGGKAGKGGGSTAGKSGGGSGGTDAGGEGGGNSAFEGIDVMITAPAAASDPNKDRVLVETDVTVVCSVKPSDPDVVVDGSSVLIEVLDAAGKVAIGQDVMPLSAKGTPTGQPDEYSASFPLTTVDTGVVSFRCSAASVDKASGGKGEVSTFIDHGPTIVTKLPEADSAHSLKGVMPVEFKVMPALLSDDDDGAEVTGVTLTVAGAKIEAPVLVQDDEDPSTYRAEVNFDDKGLFKDPPPEHTSVHIEAVNSRKPQAATAIDDYPIVVDGVGPDINITSPVQNDTVHGETVIEFTAIDTGAGLDPDTLELSLTGVAAPFKFDATKPTIWSRSGDTFKFRFDSLQLTSVAYQINVSIQAQDRAGNLKNGVTRVLNKDDFGPLVDLDPGNARGFTPQDPVKCTVSFDPLFSALNDEAKVSVSSNLFRAFVYDLTNTGSGQKTRYMSGTKRDSVRLYIQPDPTQPLLKDTNDDGVCDALARDDFRYVSLAPLTKASNFPFGPDKTTPPAVDDAFCAVDQTPSQPNSKMCEGNSDMWGVVQHDVQSGGDEPVIYAFAPSPNGFECTGKLLDLHNDTADPAQDYNVSLSPDGWVCLAATAEDNLGNFGISAPLRICLDDPNVTWPGDGVPGCMKGAAPPTCVSAQNPCTLPAKMGTHFFRL